MIPRAVASAYPYAADGASSFDPTHLYEPFSVLNFLAGCTQSIRLGTHVLIVSYRPPVYAAKVLATLDALSGGSADPGCRHQLDGRGIRSAGPRHLCAAGAVTNEYLRLLKELWTKNEVEFRGDFVHVSGIGFWQKPVQRPHPPIWIGGRSLPALRCAALPGDGWMPIGLRPLSLLGPADMANKIAHLRAHLRKANLAEDAVRISFTAPVVITGTPASPRPLLQGRPEEIATDLGQYQALGVCNFNINLPGFEIDEQVAAMERFATDVIPLLS